MIIINFVEVTRISYLKLLKKMEELFLSFINIGDLDTMLDVGETCNKIDLNSALLKPRVWNK